MFAKKDADIISLQEDTAFLHYISMTETYELGFLLAFGSIVGFRRLGVQISSRLNVNSHLYS